MKPTPFLTIALRYFTAIFAAVCAVVSIQASANTVLFEAKYVAEYTGIDIDIKRSLIALKDNKYAYELVADGGLATIKENSIFSIGDTCLLPLDYYYRRKIMGFGGKEALNFDWNKKQAIYVKDGKKKARHILNIPIYDPALYQLQMQLDLHANKHLLKDADEKEISLQYRYMHRKKLRDREFRVVGKDTYNLGGTDYEALVVERVSLEPNKTTTIWVLPALYHQIAYIRQIEDGDAQETSLVSFNANTELLTKFYSDATLPTSPNNQNPAPLMK